METDRKGGKPLATVKALACYTKHYGDDTFYKHIHALPLLGNFVIQIDQTVKGKDFDCPTNNNQRNKHNIGVSFLELLCD